MGGKVLRLQSDIIKEEGIKEGIKEGINAGKKEGETLLGKLVIKLMSLGKNDDVIRVSSDVKYREKMYTLYGIK